MSDSWEGFLNGIQDWVCPYCGKEFWVVPGEDPAEEAQAAFEHLEAERAAGHQPLPGNAS